MVNYLLETQGGKHVGKLWAHRFVQRRQELKIHFNCVYDFQRALCKDPKLIGDWFRLFQNIQAKYSVVDTDIYNFDKTSFMIGQICPRMVVIYTNQCGRSKAVQPGNREWATAIICIDGEGGSILPFLVVQGAYHLANWYTKSGLPYNWVIKPANNGQTNNKTGLDWIKYFKRHIAIQAKGLYQMLILDGHKSYKSVAFQEYCKAYNIITLGLSPHLSYLTQPLDVGYFSVLKQSYSREIKTFIQAHINHITKVKFFIVFKAVYQQSLTIENAQARFSRASLVPFLPEIVLGRLDIRLQTLTLTLPSSEEANLWVSQTPCNPTNALSQTTLVKSCIASYQGSSPTPIFETVAVLAKGTEILAHENTLLATKVCTLRKANEALSKCQRAKKTCLYQRGALTIEDAHNIIAQKEVDKQI